MVLMYCCERCYIVSNTVGAFGGTSFFYRYCIYCQWGWLNHSMFNDWVYKVNLFLTKIFHLGLKVKTKFKSKIIWKTKCDLNHWYKSTNHAVQDFLFLPQIIVPHPVSLANFVMHSNYKYNFFFVFCFWGHSPVCPPWFLNHS